MIQKIREIANSTKWIDILFTVLILTFPFGSHLLSLSIGFMTIYPHLIVLLILTGLSLFSAKKNYSKLEKYFLFFLLFMLCYALAYLPFVSGKRNAIIDIRSIALMLMTSYVFIATSKILGLAKWRSTLLFSLKLIFVLVLCFSVFEMLTEIHFIGEFTKDISIRGLEDDLLKTPVFLWDNPNNLVAYIVLIGLAILLLEKSSPTKKIWTWLILITLFFISFICKARLGIFISLSLTIVYCVYLVWYLFAKGNAQNIRMVISYSTILLVGIVIVFLTKDKFYKIPDHQIRSSNEAVLVYSVIVDSTTNTEILIKNDRDSVILANRDTTAEKVVYSRNGSSSENERLALIKNGIDFTFQSKLMGVGPGQYRELHETNQIRNFAHGNNSAHFWLVELISQYGIFTFVAYIILLFWIFIASLKIIKSSPEVTTYFIMALIGFMGASCLPSGFLILDINWIFVAILVILASNIKEIVKSSND